MNGAAGIDLEEALDGQKVGGPLIVIIIVSMLVMISDGFDLAVMGYLAPELVKDWGLGPTDLVPAFTSGIIGLMVGGPLLGILGDRFGRKRLILWGMFGIAITTLVTLVVRTTTELVVLRFFTGIALGGVVPNVGALIAELTPRRVRGRILVIVLVGAALGVSLPGIITAAVVPAYGWRALMLVGGFFPLLVALAAVWLLPESVQYLARRGGRDAQIRAILKNLRPDLAIDAATPLIHAGGRAASREGAPQTQEAAGRLFGGDFRLVTPMLWICQAAIHLANFFSLTWLPTILQSGGASTAEAGITSSLFSLGGIASSLLLLAFLDRAGVLFLLFLMLIGAPLVAMMTIPDLSIFTHGSIIAAAGFCVLGAQLAITSLLGLLYPTSIRSTGAGWTQAAGRVGALGAPLLGGLLLDMHVRTEYLPLAPALFLVTGAAAALVLAVMSIRRFGHFRPREFSFLPRGAGVAAAD